jgi:hypothetical protein
VKIRILRRLSVVLGLIGVCGIDYFWKRSLLGIVLSSIYLFIVVVLEILITFTPSILEFIGVDIKEEYYFED